MKLRRQELIDLVAQNAVKIREKKGITQSQLARLCGKHRQSIQRFEAGLMNPSLYFLSVIARRLDVTISELVNVPKIKTTSKQTKK